VTLQHKNLLLIIFRGIAGLIQGDLHNVGKATSETEQAMMAYLGGDDNVDIFLLPPSSDLFPSYKNGTNVLTTAVKQTPS
jgi:hypothetical protein